MWGIFSGFEWPEIEVGLWAWIIVPNTGMLTAFGLDITTLFGDRCGVSIELLEMLLLSLLMIYCLRFAISTFNDSTLINKWSLFTLNWFSWIFLLYNSWIVRFNLLIYSCSLLGYLLIWWNELVMLFGELELYLTFKKSFTSLTGDFVSVIMLLFATSGDGDLIGSFSILRLLVFIIVANFSDKCMLVNLRFSYKFYCSLFNWIILFNRLIKN